MIGNHELSTNDKSRSKVQNKDIFIKVISNDSKKHLECADLKLADIKKFASPVEKELYKHAHNYFKKTKKEKALIYMQE